MALKREAASGRYTLTHGRSRDPEYSVWGDMIYRCHTPSAPNYASYGGRGIVVCDRWRYDYSEFFADMGTRPEGFSIERRDNDGNYEPANCSWALPVEQAQNRRNTPRVLGLSPRQLSTQTGLPLQTIRGRIRRGWSEQRIVAQARRAYPETVSC